VSDAVTMPVLRIAGLRIRRGRTVVVDGLDLEHAAGRLAWITGENGAGKSSLLRVLAGRLRPESGSLARSPADGATAYYQPGMALPADARVADWWRALGRASPPAAPLTPEVEARRRVARVSTGEGKRLLLAAVLARPTPFTFLDEPYEHLSPNAKRDLTALLVARAAAGVVIVATNQDVPETGNPVVIRLDTERAQR
jgi:heme exporter protein A